LNTYLSIISLHIFNLLFDCLINYLYMRVLKLTLGKIIISANLFLYFQLFSVKCPDGLGLQSGCMRSCWLLVWQVDRPKALVTCLDAILTGFYLFLCFPCHPHTIAFLLIYHVMLCVCLADFSRDVGILCTSLLIPWYLLCLPLFF
jgi:hypothetical protein